MKYCIDCKHYRHYQAADVCVSPNLRIDLVTGKPIFILAKDVRYAKPLRDLNACGEIGEWFEPIIKIAEDLDDLSTIPFGK
jgi:hypothetical protein